MKKFLVVVSILCALLLIPQRVTASSVISGNCGANTKYLLDGYGNLYITGNGEMTDFTFEERPPWHNYRTEIKNVIICDGVTHVGDYSFELYRNVESVTLGKNVVSVGNAAFDNTSITSLLIPESLTTIDKYAFDNCYKLTSIVVEAGNTVFDSRNNCNAIIKTAKNQLILGCHNTIIPNTVTNIGPCAFEGCVNLTSIDIPSSVTVIEENAFNNCSNLVNINLSRNLATIGGRAFGCCLKLENISLPSSLRKIEASAFADCSSLTEIVIPYGVTSIGMVAFTDCTNLEKVTIPSSVTYIGDNPFYACPALKTINIDTTTIGDWFQKKASIKNINIGNHTRSISTEAFMGCSGLDKVTIENGLTTIGSKAFMDCVNLSDIVIPSSVTTIGEDAFKDCLKVSFPCAFQGSSYGCKDPSYYHNYQFDYFIWEGYTAKAKCVCMINHQHYITEDAEISKEVIDEATCISEGKEIYTASYEGHTSTKERKLEIDSNNHDLLHHKYVPAEQYKDGSLEHWECKRCHRYFTDEQGENEVSLEEILIHAYYPVIDYQIDSCNSLKINIDWSEECDEYEIYRSTDKKKYHYLATFYDNEYIDNELEYGKIYYYKVVATIGEDRYSSNVIKATFAIKKPELKVEIINDVQMRFSWNEDLLADGYQIYYATSKKGTYKKLVDITDETEYIWDKAITNKTYYLKARSYKKIKGKNKYSSYSNIVSAKVAIVNPVITKCTGSPFDVDVEWSGDQREVSYTLYRSTSKTKGFVELTTTDECSYQDTDVVYGKTYYYKVIANLDYDGYDHLTSYSALRSAKISVATPKIVSSYALPYQAMIQWEWDDNATNYLIYRSTSKTKGFKKIAEVDDSCQYFDDDVIYGKTYYYKVVENINFDDKDHLSDYSPVKGIKIILDTPVITLTSDVGKVIVIVDKLDEADGYEVYYASSKSGTYRKVATLGDKHNYEYFMKANKTGYFKVRSYTYVDGKKCYSSYSAVKAAKAK